MLVQTGSKELLHPWLDCACRVSVDSPVCLCPEAGLDWTAPTWRLVTTLSRPTFPTWFSVLLRVCGPLTWSLTSMTSGAESVSAGRPRLLLDCLKLSLLCWTPSCTCRCLIFCPLATCMGTTTCLDVFAMQLGFFPELVWGEQRREATWQWVDLGQQGFRWGRREVECLERLEFEWDRKSVV